MTAAQEVQTPSMSADTISDMKLREAPPTTGAARGLMLHELALRMSSDPTVALEGFKMVAKANVEAAKIPDMNGRLPLHNAAMNENIRMDVIERLLQMYPESPLVADHAGWLPLHHAVACERVNVTLVTKLCEVAPPAVLKMCNDKQWTPLDLLLVRHVGRVAARARRGHDRTDREELVQRTMEVCQILLRTNNKCCRATDLKGRFPLHLVLETYHLDLPLFRLLVNEYPHAVSHRAKAAEGCEVGELPLHIALRHLRVPGVTHRFTMISSKVEHPPVEQTRLNEAIETESYRDALSAVGDLIRLAPTTAQECASDGSLPLHQAIFYGLGGTDFPSRRLTSLMHYQHPPPRLEPTVETTPESESDDEDEDKKDTRERGSALLLAERRKKAEEEALLHDEALLEGSIREYYRKHAPDKTREDVLAAVAQFKEILGKDHEDESRQLVEKKFLALTLYISIAKMCDQVEVSHVRTCIWASSLIFAFLICGFSCFSPPTLPNSYKHTPTALSLPLSLSSQPQGARENNWKQAPSKLEVRVLLPTTLRRKSTGRCYHADCVGFFGPPRTKTSEENIGRVRTRAGTREQEEDETDAWFA